MIWDDLIKKNKAIEKLRETFDRQEENQYKVFFLLKLIDKIKKKN